MFSKVASGIGKALIGFGIVVLLFVVYQLWGTGYAESHSQTVLRSQFQSELKAISGTTSSTGVSPTTTTTLTSTVAGPMGDPAVGNPVGYMQIPKIGISAVVVEGTEDAELSMGPGHYPGTPLPGQAGNVAIAGHRTTFGHPFYNLNELAPGDPIYITTLQGRFEYQVFKSFVVPPNDVSVAAPTLNNQLTLTTCNPRYSAAQRLVVQANLVLPTAATPGVIGGGKLPTPNPAPARTQAISSLDSKFGKSNLKGKTGSVASAVLRGLLLVVAMILAWFLATRREAGSRRLIVYVASTPFLLALLFYFFVSINPLLPAQI